MWLINTCQHCPIGMKQRWQTSGEPILCVAGDLVIFYTNRWHCRSCSFWPLWYYIFNWRGGITCCQPLVDKPWTLSRPTKLYSTRDTCINIKPQWSVKLINISLIKKKKKKKKKQQLKYILSFLTEKFAKKFQEISHLFKLSQEWGQCHVSYLKTFVCELVWYVKENSIIIPVFLMNF